ncbi:hypothetical protein [Aureimonas jatrophae]|uniref:Peptide-methionine (S)-S-oxide reductase n=1 Tax=Aureimonas jatrophae TaxID=1166073 RepID=A0A1H0DEZ0_9HYPH|nr:hypothetical protein [Aureimonas jatrophae]MBB3951856.1 peptide-methionine (S)-S-oxide reductase [Aureimonas jatrophae]SDN68668.1 peptide-methionine (S)-S-oxide reductase [Aureimonas jatrophae]
MTPLRIPASLSGGLAAATFVAAMPSHAVVTTIETGQLVDVAKAYRQADLAQNPDAPSIVAYDLPKIGDLDRLFSERSHGQPVPTSRAATN